MERAVFVPDLDRLPPPGGGYDRLYLGSESCVRRLPGEPDLTAALREAAARGMSFTLVTPFLDEPGLAHALGLVQALPDLPGIEVVANDLGLIEALRADGWAGTLVAGRLLTRQRRGPGVQSFGEVPAAAAAALRGSALDAPGFVDLLGEAYGVRRFELDDLVQGATVPAVPSGVGLSLYRPWLLVTATRNCPWVFDGRDWDRRRCARQCRGRLLHLEPTSEEDPTAAEGWREAGAHRRADRSEHGGGAQRQDPGACTGMVPVRCQPLVLGSCAQFLEHRNDAPPPPGVDRIVRQPGVPA